MPHNFISNLLKTRFNFSKFFMARPCSDYTAFRKKFEQSRHLVVLTGAGISAESGIPTFRGAGGFWRTYQSQELATPGAFNRDPSLVWEFYHYRRDVVLSKEPNAAHKALAKVEKEFRENNKQFAIITQNIDDLHHKAGSENVIQLHGSLFKVRCTKCHAVTVNKDSPICPALAGRGAPDVDKKLEPIPVESLPKCVKCEGLLRPHVVWFGEMLEEPVLTAAQAHMDSCDLALVVGTSSVVYPAAMFAPQIADRGVPVAEFNLEATPATHHFGFHFNGSASETLPKAVGISD